MKQLVLLGGGHAHVHCVSSFIEKRLEDVKVTLISPFARQVYSGMLPGWIAGHYAIDECVIPLPPLAVKAGISFEQSAASGLDLERRVVHCENGAEIPYDILSIDSGPLADLSQLPGAAQHALAVRPIECFIEGWEAARRQLMARAGGRIVMVGAGAAGVELALAMQHAFDQAKIKLDFTIASAADTLPHGVAKRLMRVLRERNIRVLVNTPAQRIEAAKVIVPGGELEADLVIVSTGTAAAAWPRAAGLKTDERGFILTNKYLQSLSHANVFAAGDCATMAEHVRPKSGVYAVRAGAPLTKNLRHALAGEALDSYTPQRNSLYLISAGNQYAIASWGNFTLEGAWVWRWKDSIDRNFVARYR